MSAVTEKRNSSCLAKTWWVTIFCCLSQEEETLDEKRKREEHNEQSYNWADIVGNFIWNIFLFVIANVVLIFVLPLMWTTIVMDIFPNAVDGGMIPRYLKLGQASTLLLYMNVLFLGLSVMKYAVGQALTIPSKETPDSTSAAAEETE